MNQITLNYSDKKDLELLLRFAEQIGIFPIDTSGNTDSTIAKVIPFDPKKYCGILSPLKLNIEQELLNMRNEWKRDF